MKNFFIAGIMLIALTGCGTHKFVSTSFTPKLTQKTKKTATILVPDTHIIELSFGDSKEEVERSKLASSIFIAQGKREFSSIFRISMNTVGTFCPSMNPLAKSCSADTLKLRKLINQGKTLSRKKKLYAEGINLPTNTDVSIYIRAIEPTRSTSMALTSGLLTGVLAVATGGTTFVQTVHDVLEIMVIDNKTKEVLWYDMSVSGSLDIDKKNEVKAALKSLVKNMKLHKKRK